MRVSVYLRKDRTVCLTLLLCLLCCVWCAQRIKEKQIIIPKRDIPDGWSIEAADFVNKLLQRKPVQRLGWAGIE